MTPKTSATIELQHLQLEGAHALLSRESSIALPLPETSAINYLQGVIDGLCELSLKDPLTGLANRRHFCAVLDRVMDVVARSGEPALLLLLDIDHFKKINDTYGHPVGDMVLKTVAHTLARCVRPMDTVARYGGEEFSIVLPSCQTSFGATVAERIRQSIDNLTVPVSPGVSLHVTISIGGAYAHEWVRSTGAMWTERADVQLYRAKSEGRNRVFLDHQQEICVSAEEKSLLFGHLSLGTPAWSETVSNEGTDHSSVSSEQGI